MSEQRLTATSYAVLGLLDVRTWSTYELTKQMRRTLRSVWPRAESNLYREPQRLVEAGFATAEQRLVGRRTRTEYSITEAGRQALHEWLLRPAAPTVLGSEAMIKVLFGDSMPLQALRGHLLEFGQQAEDTDRAWRAIAREYIDGRGPFPERIHVNALYWVLLDRWARLRAEWADWADAEVASWPSPAGPVDRSRVQALLERALGDSPGFLHGATPARRDRRTVGGATKVLEDRCPTRVLARLWCRRSVRLPAPPRPARSQVVERAFGTVRYEPGCCCARRQA